MKKIAIVGVFFIVIIVAYLMATNKNETAIVQSNSKKEFRYKPAKFRSDTPFMCGANISREVAKLYFNSKTLVTTFDNRPYIWNREGGVQPELDYYVTSDHYTNPNQLYMEVEVDGSSIRISGDSITPKGIVYSCFEID